MMARRSFLGVVAALWAALGLSGCGKTQSYRYKLTLEVETPEGVKRAFNVVEITFHEVSIPAQGLMAAARGEALYLDLGPGRRPLVALLTKKYRKGMPWAHWDEIQPTTILARVYDEKLDRGDSSGDAWRERIFRHRGAREIAPGDLPDLVTFADINDPKSVTAVDPDNLEATLGPGVKWKRVTLEVTDEPVTTGIGKKLPWLASYIDRMLDGHRPGQPSDGSLASKMNTASFHMGGQ
jgi:hypothetical protein